jgi:NitT/TauT family transport system substrate-binding protein
MAMYASGAADATFGTPVGSVHVVQAKRPTRYVLLADFDLNVPSFGLIASEATLKKKGEALRAFASITSGAWAYIASGGEDRQEEAVQALVKARAQDRIDPNHIRIQLKNSIPFLHTPATANLPIGVQSADDWARAIVVLEKAKVIDPGSKPSNYFTNDYLNLNLVRSIAAGG